MTNQIKVGDTVMLKSGGSKMTVSSGPEENFGKFECVWQNKDNKGNFHPMKETYSAEVLQLLSRSGPIV